MKQYQKFSLSILALAIVWSVIHPYSYGDWILEIIPVFVAIPILIIFNKKYKFSTISFISISLFLLLGIIEAHYSVARVPFGFTLGEWFGSSRNMFDRLMHFLFGALLFYPLYEVFKATLSNRKFFHYFIPSSIVLALSAIYEIAEWWSHTITTAGVSKLFLGAQGDRWDPQKDMAMAAIGVLLSATITYLVLRKKKETSIGEEVK